MLRWNYNKSMTTIVASVMPVTIVVVSTVTIVQVVSTVAGMTAEDVGATECCLSGCGVVHESGRRCIL